MLLSYLFFLRLCSPLPLSPLTVNSSSSPFLLAVAQARSLTKVQLIMNDFIHLNVALTLLLFSRLLKCKIESRRRTEHSKLRRTGRRAARAWSWGQKRKGLAILDDRRITANRPPIARPREAAISHDGCMTTEASSRRAGRMTTGLYQHHAIRAPLSIVHRSPHRAETATGPDDFDDDDECMHIVNGVQATHSGGRRRVGEWGKVRIEEAKGAGWKPSPHYLDSIGSRTPKLSLPGASIGTQAAVVVGGLCERLARREGVCMAVVVVVEGLADAALA
ncbi:hypothetical protein D9611_013949 [Ephemerocybe angulata]|uniref:Uncharacterized protein n=1 Tax=Ephemerocybe angulata TaxID=980116 RepID=A0A8H5ERE7_9AGAR|nr:hypothetical protein D9611_013949 [Tulosesus angulatus]